MTRNEAIVESRRKLKAGEFDRAVLSVEPDDVHWDRLVLECGHWTAWAAKLHSNGVPPERDACYKCAREWVDDQSGEKP